MNTGFPLHLTVIVLPISILLRSTSREAMARTSLEACEQKKYLSLQVKTLLQSTVDMNDGGNYATISWLKK